jgi:hypothetical protein
MLEQITVRVELGPYVLVGREVGHVEVHQAVGAHAHCTLHFTRDPQAVASPVAALRLAELAGALVRVVFLANGGSGAEAHLAFAGRVRAAEVEHLATGAGDVTVVAHSDSHVLAEHADRRYFREHTPAALAGALGVRVAGALPAGDARDYVQAGVSAWAFLAQVAAEEGLQLRARWPRTPDGAADEPAELGQGFGDEAHQLTWGRELLRLSTALAPVNAGVTGAFYDPAAKHDHRFRGVRAQVEWLGGARPVVAAAREASTGDADGGDPGHLEPGRAAGVRARTQEEFRARLELASARRLGAAVRARGVSVHPGLRAGDRVEVLPAPELMGAGGGAAGGDGELADRTGTFGLTTVVHRWTGTLYENDFEATPWATYHLPPEAVAAGGAGGRRRGRRGRRGGGARRGGGRGRPEGDGARARAAGVDGRGRAHGVGARGRARGRQGAGARRAAERGRRGGGRRGGRRPRAPGDPRRAVERRRRGRARAGAAALGDAGGQHAVVRRGEAGRGPGDRRAAHEAGQGVGAAGAEGAHGRAHGDGALEGDLALEAPNGQLRVTAKSYVAHVAGEHATQAGAHTVRSGGAVTVESGARLALKAGGELALRAGGALKAHGAAGQTLTGATLALNPPGATAPAVSARVPALPASAWGARPVPGPGPGRSTEDPKTPTRRELAARQAQRASLAAVPADATRVAALAVAPPAPEGEPQTLAAKKARLAQRQRLVQSARDRAATLPAGPERTQLLSTAARFEDDTRAVDRMRLAKHAYDYYATGAPPPVGFEQFTTDEQLARYGLAPEDLAPPRSNFRATLYRSQLDASGKPIVAFRGTIMDSGEDWKNNVYQGLGIPSDHYARALDIGDKLAEATGGRGGFETVGHSLGGGMASAVSAKERMRGDTFNAAGVSETTLRRVNASRADGANLVNAYQVEGEVLTALQDRNNQRAALLGSSAIPGVGPVAVGALGLARELAGDRILPTALGRARTIPAVDPPEYQGLGALNPYKFVNRHLSPSVIAGFEQEKAEDSRALGAPALR